MNEVMQKIYLIRDFEYAMDASQRGDGHFVVCDRKGNVFEPDYIAAGEADRSEALRRGGEIMAEFPNENAIVYFGMWLYEGFSKVAQEVIGREMSRKGYDDESREAVCSAYRKIFGEILPSC